jgi:hypothetical protein
MPRLGAIITPSLQGLHIHLYRNPVGVVNVQTRVYHLAHSGDHDLLDELGYLLDLILGGLDDQLIVHGVGVTVMPMITVICRRSRTPVSVRSVAGYLPF